MQEAVFKGASGKLYRFTALRPDADFPSGPAVYAFARPGSGAGYGCRNWTPVFMSRTANLAVRMSGHERWNEARRLGATHVMILAFNERSEREAAEHDLVEAMRPVMNDAGPTQNEDAPLAPGQVLHFFPPIKVRAAKAS